MPVCVSMVSRVATHRDGEATFPQRTLMERPAALHSANVSHHPSTRRHDSAATPVVLCVAPPLTPFPAEHPNQAHNTSLPLSTLPPSWEPLQERELRSGAKGPNSLLPPILPFDTPVLTLLSETRITTTSHTFPLTLPGQNTLAARRPIIWTTTKT